MSAVIIRCNSYDDNLVREAIDGILDSYPYPWEGKRVLLKVNLVTAIAYDKAATTHPAVVKAVASYLVERGAKVVIGDSPGGPYTKMYMSQVYNVSGMKTAAEESGAELNYDYDHVTTDFESIAMKQLEIIKVFEDCDVVLNLAKLKTHELTGFTGAVKNYFGLVPGLVKIQYHGQNSDVNKFSDLLIDIQRYAAPKTLLHIVDGVVGMEGPGPTSGKPRAVGAILASTDPYEVDTLCMRLIGLDPDTVPYMRRAIERGILTEYARLPEEYDDLIVKDYKIVKLKSSILPINWMPKRAQRYVERHITRHPRVNTKKCVGCGKCERHCPPKAIVIREGKARVDYDACIRCFCCQELCPYHVIKVARPLLYRILRF